MPGTNPTSSDPNVRIVNDCNLNSEPKVTSENVITTTSLSGTPSVCFIHSASMSAGGAVAGFLFGYASGLIMKQGFAGSFAQARSSAKELALFCGFDSLFMCLLKRLRWKSDVLNAGVAGCCTGLAISFPGTPQILLMNCVWYGAISSIVESLMPRKPMMHSYSSKVKQDQEYGILSPLTIPLPNELQESFAFFCKSMKECCKLNFRGRSP